MAPRDDGSGGEQVAWSPDSSTDPCTCTNGLGASVKRSLIAYDHVNP